MSSREYYIFSHKKKRLDGGFKYVLFFTPKIGEMIQFDEHIFQMGWFNHQLEEIGAKGCNWQEVLSTRQLIYFRYDSNSEEQ